MFQIIAEKEAWDDIIERCDQVDFYHTYDYHIIAKNDLDKAILCTFIFEEVIIAIPLLIRKIENTNYFDATSVYGYAGPVSKGITNKFDNDRFKKILLDHLFDSKIVAVFSRLNPFIPSQEIILNNIGIIKNKGKVVAIDLSKPTDDQRSAYHKRLKTYINMARRECDIKIGSSDKDLKDFLEIYWENMDRVKADKFYFFDSDYFKALINSTSFKTIILLAREKESGRTIAGNMFVIKNGIVQYHLSGTRNDSLRLMPNKLLIDEMRINATKASNKVFNLGGGIGGSSEDSLFKFKSSFSKDLRVFKVWNLIVDQEKYNELLKSKLKVKSDFFPEYRQLP